MAISIVFETHSISEDNERGIATGWLPGRLSSAGRELARELGQRRQHDGIDAIFTSDLIRAVETASIAFAGSAIPIARDRRLREISYGTLNGAPAAQIHAQRSAHVDTPFPGGQSYREVVQQMREFLDDIAPGRDGQRLLLIGHSATKFALDCLLTGRPLEDAVGAPFDWQPGWEYRFNPDELQPHQHDLIMFIVDVLKYDMETVRFTLDLLNNQRNIGWRFAWKGEFTEDDVIPALEELLNLSYVRCLEEDAGARELVPVDARGDVRARKETLWFVLTQAGRAAWERWDPPIDENEGL